MDTDRERADAFAETHGCEAYTSSDEVLRRDDVQLVLVALPNFLHEQATVEAASAGKHVTSGKVRCHEGSMHRR